MSAFNILILAAGESKRMGQVKQLLNYRGKTFMEHTLDRAIHLRAKTIYTVLGAHMEKIRPIVTPYSVEIIENHEWKDGMGSSLAKGVEYISIQNANREALLILLIDQPEMMIDENYLPFLITTWRKYPDKVIATKYGNRYGVPCVFPADLVSKLLDCQGSRGATHILNSASCDVLGLEAGKLKKDFDRPEDLLSEK
jgi:molybdenum cofactor cytidylyltransferase